MDKQEVIKLAERLTDDLRGYIVIDDDHEELTIRVYHTRFEYQHMEGLRVELSSKNHTFAEMHELLINDWRDNFHPF